MARIGLILFPPPMMKNLGMRFRGLGVRLIAAFPGLAYDLTNAQIEIRPDYYAVSSFFSALVFSIMLTIFILLIVFIRQFEFPLSFLLPFMTFLMTFIIFFMVNIIYPRIISKSVASMIDRGLLFAARDMLIQISSGITLFQALSNVAEGDYGQVSVEFKRVVNETRSGSSLTQALEDMALRNQSQYLRKMCWQIITAMRSGANLTTAIKGIIKLLVDYQMQQIKSYNAELNFIVLIYLLAAAVLPTVGTTILVIFSVFGVLGITPEIYIGMVLSACAVQSMIIAYVYVRRPKMYEQ